LPGVRAELEKFARLDVLQSGSAGEAVSLIAETDLSEYDGLIAVGGDGTLFAAVNGLYAHDKSKRIPLGLVPAGTGNAFARDLGLAAGDWEKAVGLIRAGHVRPVDVGRVVTPAETYFFLNVVGAGLVVDALRTAEKLKSFRIPAYTLAALWHVIKLKSYPLSIEIDGKNIHMDSMFLEISNSRYTGASFLIAPDAVFDDGLFDVTLVKKLSRMRLLRLFPTIYQGHHIRFEEIETFKAKQVRITAPSDMALAPDGEIRGCTPVTVTCLQRDQQIFCPQQPIA
jgi:YegS/Rv2252/BmrU family lipid kinase